MVGAGRAGNPAPVGAIPGTVAAGGTGFPVLGVGGALTTAVGGLGAGGGVTTGGVGLEIGTSAAFSVTRTVSFISGMLEVCLDGKVTRWVSFVGGVGVFSGSLICARVSGSSE